MEALFTSSRVTSIDSPKMYWTIQYDYKRSGTDMLYQFKWNVYLGTTTGWYDDAMQLQLFLNGVQNNVTVKPFKSDNKGWNYSGTTGWYTVANKTSGTTPFYAVLKDTSTGSVKATSSTYQLHVSPCGATLSSASNFTDEENPTIYYSNPLGNNVDALEVCITPDDTNVEVDYKTVQKTGSQFTFSLTEEERKVLRRNTTAPSRTVHFVLKTTIDGVDFYSYAKSTLSIVNGNPSFTSSQITYDDSNTAIKNITGSTTSSPIIVKGKSSLAITYTAAKGEKEATITKYEFTLNGEPKTVNSAGGGTVDFGLINSDSNLTLTAKVTDSRGNSTTVTKTIVVEQYTNPTLSPYGSNSTIICGRSNSSGTLDRSGTSLKVAVKASCFSLSNWKNTGTLSLLGLATNEIPLDSVNGSVSYNDVVPSVTLAATSVYTVIVKCADRFGESECAKVTFTIPSQYADFHLKKGGKGAAFGELATESNVLSIAAEWLLKAKGGISAVGKKITDVATPTATTDATNKAYVDAINTTLTHSIATTNNNLNALATTGTWIPTVNTGSLSSVTATYAKVGSLVHVFLNAAYTTGNADITLQISGLPYTAKYTTAGTIGWTNIYFYTSKEHTTAMTNIVPEVVGGNKYITLSGWSGGRMWGDTKSNCINSGTFRLCITYQIS